MCQLSIESDCFHQSKCFSKIKINIFFNARRWSMVALQVRVKRTNTHTYARTYCHPAPPGIFSFQNELKNAISQAAFANFYINRCGLMRSTTRQLCFSNFNNEKSLLKSSNFNSNFKTCYLTDSDEILNRS